jgi:hypothetical protein
LLVAERWVEKVIEVRKVCVRIVLLRVAVGKCFVCEISICPAGRSPNAGEGIVLLCIEKGCIGYEIR